MYKSSSRHLGWLGISKNHIANNRSIDENPIARRSDFISKLHDRARMKAIVNSVEAGKLLIHFGHDDIYGEASLPLQHVELKPNDPVVVELGEKACRKGKLYLVTKFIRKIMDEKKHVCKRCETSFSSFEELKYHVEYLCNYQKCRFCGELYQSKGEAIHETGRCKFTVNSPPRKRKKPNKK